MLVGDGYVTGWNDKSAACVVNGHVGMVVCKLTWKVSLVRHVP